MKYYRIVFSPTGGTEKVAKAIMKNWKHIFPGCRRQMLQRIATADRLRTAKKQAGRTEAGLSGGRIFSEKGTCHA